MLTNFIWRQSHLADIYLANMASNITNFTKLYTDENSN